MMFESWRSGRANVQRAHGPSSNGRSFKKRLVRHLKLESLETRQLLAAVPVSYDPLRGSIEINGASSEDVAIVTQTPNDAILVVARVDGNVLRQAFPRTDVRKVVFQGREGDDRFVNFSDVTVVAYGNDGHDFLRGGLADDQLYGQDGNDQLQGAGGNDELYAGAGTDVLLGGAGDDSILGDEGDDWLLGGDGHDVLRGGLGDDVLFGHDGDDDLGGGAGRNQAHGGDGDDRITGGELEDTLIGGPGADHLSGDSGNDLLSGGAGADMLIGGAHDDVLFGGEGDDYMFGVAGNDNLHGDQHNDILDGGDGDDQLEGGAGDDEIAGGRGNDLIVGGWGEDLLSGAAGRDELRGGDGDDRLFGHQDPDKLNGGPGDDYVFGGEDDDVVAGGTGQDVVRGGEGRDVLIGGPDRDELFGENDDDILIGGATDFDDDTAALDWILGAWSVPVKYDVRVGAMAAPSNPLPLEAAATVHDDAVADALHGGAGDDWYFLTGPSVEHDDVHVGSLGQDHHHDHEYEHEHSDGRNFDNILDLASHETVSSNVPHADNPTMREEHLAVFELVDRRLATHTSASSGLWSEPSTWVDGVLPESGAMVLIASGVTVTVDGVFDEPLRWVRVDGMLEFDPTTDTELRVDTLVVDPGGVFEMGDSGAPIAPDATARLVIADIGPIGRHWDPFALSRGAVIHGTASIHGAETTPFLPLSEAPRAGDTQLNVAGSPINWKVGDRLVLAGTSPDEDQNEVREIRQIQGTVITVDPLAYDHPVPHEGLQVHVANLTRNASIRSENPELDRRGHVMFMHTRSVSVKYAGFYQLGRTDKKFRANDPVLDEHGRLEPATGLNPRGRYSVHFHRNGVTSDGRPAVVHGSVVEDNPGWGFVNHSSFVTFTDNVAYAVDGAAFVTEAGDEIGTFQHNLAIAGQGSEDGRSNADPMTIRSDIQDFGHQGDGFWFQGSGVDVVDNIAAGQRGSGFAFFVRGLAEPELGNRMFRVANLSDPTTAAGQEMIPVSEATMAGFNGNTTYASGIGATVRYHHELDTQQNYSNIEDLTLWNNTVGLDLTYSNQLILRDVFILGNPDDVYPVGVEVNHGTRNISFENLFVSGYATGLRMPRRGNNEVIDGYFSNLRDIEIRTSLEEDRSITLGGTIAFGRLPASALQGRSQERIVMKHEFKLHRESFEHLFFSDTVMLDFGIFNQVQLYYLQQKSSFAPLLEPETLVAPQFIGMSNEQLWRRYHVAVGGEMAPDNAVVVPGITGLVAA